jgi:hypothetical protein
VRSIYIDYSDLYEKHGGTINKIAEDLNPNFPLAIFSLFFWYFLMDTISATY